MARTNMTQMRVKPATDQLITLHVLRRERLTPHVERVTLGHGDIEAFVPMGLDQWFRLFLPVPGGSLERVPHALDTRSYLRFLMVSKSQRPILRNYSVRQYRAEGPEGPELDVDVVLHGSPADGTAGPAATWAQTCRRGDPVALLDEGTMFRLPADADHVLLVADETGLPAAAGILAALPAEVTGRALIELPGAEDRQALAAPPGVEITWLPREDAHATPGTLALATAQELAAPTGRGYGWVVGEQGLTSGVRRHWVGSGLPKDRLMFCGYWKARR